MLLMFAFNPCRKIGRKKRKIISCFLTLALIFSLIIIITVSIPMDSGYASMFFIDNIFSHTLPLGHTHKKVLIVGAGLSGAVLAHLHATQLNSKIVIIEKRKHIGGLLYDYNNDNGIRIGKYGAHFFHTDKVDVWRYIYQFCKWTPYELRVGAIINNGIGPWPINIQSLHAFYGKNIYNQNDMYIWLKKNKRVSKESDTWKQKCINNVGKQLYDDIFKPLNLKLTSRTENDMDESFGYCPPIRENWDDRYFKTSHFQALPFEGYTHLIKAMLDHPNIEVILGSDFLKMRSERIINESDFAGVFYTGRIDEYFIGEAYNDDTPTLPRLEWRSILTSKIDLPDVNFYQSMPVIEYPQPGNPWNRIVEYKHLQNSNFIGTTIVKEYTGDIFNTAYESDLYFPLSDRRNLEVFKKYRFIAERTSAKKNVYFVGGLANYQYMDMGDTIDFALNLFFYVYPHLESNKETIYGGYSKYQALSILPSDRGLPSLSFIVARCYEYYDWIFRDIPPLCLIYDVTIYIYEKCEFAELQTLIQNFKECKIHQIQLQNIGREGHSYLYHILYETNQLSDINFFLQAMPHVINIKGIKYLIQRMERNVKSFSPNSYFNISNTEMKHHFDTTDVYFCPLEIHPDYSVQIMADRICYWHELLTGNREKCLEYSSKSRFGDFTVSRPSVYRALSYHRSWLDKIFEMLSLQNGPGEGYALEVLWTLVFTWPAVEFQLIDKKCNLNKIHL